jgi:hypothetical protein
MKRFTNVVLLHDLQDKEMLARVTIVVDAQLKRIYYEEQDDDGDDELANNKNNDNDERNKFKVKQVRRAKKRRRVATRVCIDWEDIRGLMIELDFAQIMSKRSVQQGTTTAHEDVARAVGFKSLLIVETDTFYVSGGRVIDDNALIGSLRCATFPSPFRLMQEMDADDDGDDDVDNDVMYSRRGDRVRVADEMLVGDNVVGARSVFDGRPAWLRRLGTMHFFLVKQSDLIVLRNILLYSDQQGRLRALARYGIPSWSRHRRFMIPTRLRIVVQFTLLYLVPVFVFVQGLHGLFKDWTLIGDVLRMIVEPFYAMVLRVAPFLRGAIMPIVRAFRSVLFTFTPLMSIFRPLLEPLWALASAARGLVALLSAGVYRLLGAAWQLAFPLYSLCVAIASALFSLLAALGSSLYELASFMLVSPLALFARRVLMPLWRVFVYPFARVSAFFTRHRDTIETVSSAAQHTAASGARATGLASRCQQSLRKLTSVGNIFLRMARGFWLGVRHYMPWLPRVFRPAPEPRPHAAPVVQFVSALQAPRSPQAPLALAWSTSSLRPRPSRRSTIAPVQSARSSLIRSVPNMAIVASAPSPSASPTPSANASCAPRKRFNLESMLLYCWLVALTLSCSYVFIQYYLS